MLHLDVMDGHFVPNITFGAPVIKAIRNKTDIIFDVHLMISEPLKYAEDFVSAGADIITFHIESDSDTKETIEKIKSLSCKVGLSVKPKTPIEEVFPYLDDIDMVLVMTVEPGFGGQSFMYDQMEKIAKPSIFKSMAELMKTQFLLHEKRAQMFLLQEVQCFQVITKKKFHHFAEMPKFDDFNCQCSLVISAASFPSRQR